MSIEGAERDLPLTRDELSDWKRNSNDLKAETQNAWNEGFAKKYRGRKDSEK